jgi:hypothetical protein
MSETTPEPVPEEPTYPAMYFGVPNAWGMMARQLEIEEEESFDGVRSLDKTLIRFAEIDTDETFRL